MLSILDRALDKAPVIEKSRRVVMLRANWDTQDKLREWAKAAGFDLGWSYSGWPQSSYDFDFHITIAYSANAVRIEDGCKWIDPITVEPTGYEVLGEDTPALVIAPHETLSAIREFFVRTFGMVLEYPDFKPHISLSYRWAGNPEIVTSTPMLPDFPLVFDGLMVARIEETPQTSKDALPVARRTKALADATTISGTRRTADGYLVADVRVARGGNIQDYYGHEIGEGEPNQLFKVWRPEDEIFKLDSLATFAHKPVTMGHPEVSVTPDTWRRDAIGHVGSEVVRDGDFVRVPLVVMDASAITQIEAGTRQFSMGYDCELVMQAGVTKDGMAYDAFQKNIRINHCAFVPAGRAGPECRIGDSARRINNQEGSTMKTVTIDGKTFEVADDVAAALVKGTIGDTLAASAKALSDAATAIATANARADVAEKAVADEKAKTSTADQVAAMAAELIDVIDAAKVIAPKVETKGKTADAIRREVVAIALGDAAKTKPADYVSAAFDMLTKGKADTDPVAIALAKADGSTKDKGVIAADAYDTYITNAWRGGAAA